mgnify:CR=1 FL=1
MLFRSHLSLPISGGAFEFDGGAGSDTIVGSPVDATWNLTGTGAGNLGGTTGLVFTNVESLAGGTGKDTFAFALDTSFGGTIDGGAGATNPLDFSAWTNPVVVNLSMGIASGTTRASSFQDAIGGSGDDFLIGDINANRLTAGAGYDTLYGAGGADILFGNDGRDTLGPHRLDRAVTHPPEDGEAVELAVRGNVAVQPSQTFGNRLVVVRCGREPGRGALRHHERRG